MKKYYCDFCGTELVRNAHCIVTIIIKIPYQESNDDRFDVCVGCYDKKKNTLNNIVI
jgi:hypothetical protein